MQEMILSTSADAAGKAARMAVMDPHGFTITIIAVAVVFSSLLLLYLAYTLVGYICSGRLEDALGRKKRGNDEEIAAAIAMALELDAKDSRRHDKESYVITIRRKQR